MNHPGELLSAHLDGELADHERLEVAEHLQRCGLCQVELRQLAEARGWVRSLPVLELPPLPGADPGSFSASLPRGPAAWVGAVALVSLLALLGVGVLRAPEPQHISPADFSVVYGAVSSNQPGLVAVKAAIAGDAAVSGGAR